MSRLGQMSLEQLQESSRKFSELARLKHGDEVKLTNGRIAVFSNLKRKNFIGSIDGATYNIPIEMFKEVHKIAERDTEAYKSLKPGELFYINVKGDALLFKFEKIEKGNIIGKNIISGARTRISPPLYVGKVTDIK